MSARKQRLGRLSKRQRLEVLSELFAEAASGIRTVQDALQESEEQRNTTYMAVAALGRLGWIAEQGCLIAGYEWTPVVGGPDAWLLGFKNALSKLSKAVTDR
jgi:hypothetical protein